MVETKKQKIDQIRKPKKTKRRNWREKNHV